MFHFPLLDTLTKNWWVLLVRGLFAILFGAMAFAWPAPTLAALVLLYGAYALVDGLTALSTGITASAGWLALSGIAGIVVGIGTFFYPGITAIALFYLIAGWAIARGVFEIIAAIALRKLIPGAWALLVGGILSILVGVLFVAYPSPGVVALVWLIGAYAVIFGVVMIVLSFMLRGLPAKLQLHAGRV